MARRKYNETEARKMVKEWLLSDGVGRWRYNTKQQRYLELPSVSEVSGINNIESENKKTRVCYLLEILPLEIRRMIYRILFRRACDVYPTYITYKLYKKPKVSIYSYTWYPRVTECDAVGEELPRYDGSYDDLQIAWRSNPTLNQSRARKAGDFKLVKPADDASDEFQLPGSTYNEDLNATVRHYVNHRGDCPGQVLNRATVQITGVQGISLLRTCTQILEECRPVLYGENTFGFDTCGQLAKGHSEGIHSYDVFDHNRHEVPGLQLKSGAMSQGRINWAILNMFDEHAHHQKFMAEDPLTTFFRRIGRQNTSEVTKVVFEGYFRSANEGKGNRESLSYERLLPIYSVILKNVCPKLRKLGLHRCHVDYVHQVWKTDLTVTARQKLHDAIDGAVQHVVETLPSLQTLHLGLNHYVPSPEKVIEEWGHSLRWEVFVDERYQESLPIDKHIAVKVAPQDDNEIEDETAEVDLAPDLLSYIWSDDAPAQSQEQHTQYHGDLERGAGVEAINSETTGFGPFASLVDKALAASTLEQDGNEMSDTKKAGPRPSFRKGQKAKNGKRGPSSLGGEEK